MTLDALGQTLPPYARDLARNLQVLGGETHLTGQQKWGCLLACAYAVGVGPVIQAVEAAASEAGLSAEANTAARQAAAVMGMNNVYFHAVEQLANAAVRALPARLRGTIVTNLGVARADFELWALAVSAINHCEPCLRSHEAQLAQHGVADLAVQAALRIAAVVNAVSRVVAAEAARG